MSGKNFEQQVRETMGPWRLEPSGEVWGRLASGLQQRKRRRRALYVFLLAGLLAGGALLRYGTNVDASAAGEVAVLAKKQSLPGESNDTHQPAKKTASAESSKDQQPTAEQPQVVDQPSKKGDLGPVESSLIPGTKVSPVPEAAKNRGRGDARQQRPAGDRSDVVRSPKRTPVRDNDGRDIASSQQKSEGDRIAKESPPASGISLASIPVMIHEHRAYDKPFESHGAGPLSTPSLAGTDSLSVPNAGNLTDKYTRKKNITFGIQGGVGRSAYTEGLSLSTSKAADLQSNPNTGGASGGPQPQVYDYRQDPASGWTLGGWVALPLSRQWSFTVGLSYLQYSTRTPVGPWAGDSVFGYFNGRSIQYSNTSYQPGNAYEHRNRYHLLQVPLEFSWQLNKGRKMPLYWSMGLTPGYLLSSNALVKDSSQAMYYHPDNQRRFQLGLRTSLLFRLMPSTAHPVDIGPVFQYQLNSVFVDAVRENGHLYYLGLEARIPLFSLTGKQR